MKLEIITLCDSAQVYEGKLSILGSFDLIYAPQLPFKIQQFALAAKIRFTDEEKADYKIKVDIELPDKSIHQNILEGEMSIKEIKKSASLPVVVHFFGFSFEHYGTYYARLSLNNEMIGRYEFQVVKPN